MHASLCEECSDKVVFGGYVLLSVVALMCMAPVFLFTCFPLFKYMHHKRASDRKNDKMMTREDVEVRAIHIHLKNSLVVACFGLGDCCLCSDRGAGLSVNHVFTIPHAGFLRQREF